MKKVILVILILFLLTGCTNSITLDFKETINTKINLSFTLDEYNIYSDLNEREELISSIDAIRNDREAFINGNGELFLENSFVSNNDHYSAIYEYNYNYSNFDDNSVLHTCFEFFGMKEDYNNIYISMKGKSNCSLFKLIIKADDRMLSSNEDRKINNEYIWNITEENNDVYMTISKEKVDSSSFSIWNLIYLIIILILGIVVFAINKKMKESDE